MNDADREATQFARQSFILKYALFIILLTVVGVWLFAHDPTAFSLTEVAKGIIYSVISAMLVTFFYDAFTRRESSFIHKQDLKEVRDAMERKFIGHIQFETLNDKQRKDYVDFLIGNETVLRAITRGIVGYEGDQIYDTFFMPLVRRRALSDVYIENILRQADESKSSYYFDFNQRFVAPLHKSEFLILFSCDNDLFNDFVTSGVEIDAMIGTARSEWHDIDQQISSVKLEASRIGSDNKRETRLISPRKMRQSDLDQRLGVKISDPNLVRALCFDIEHQSGPEWRLYFSYTIKQSFEHPYYYWFAENPMFVSKVIIDYSGISDSIGGIFPNCILGNNSTRAHHDRRRRTYTVEIDGLVWPGQGAIVVWQSQPLVTK